MKIAIIAPSPVPFTIGGAEKLWQSLYQYINDNTTYQCELMKLPSKEHSFWDIIDTYKAFYQLNLSHFDMVISGKYPAWMVKHHNHHLYMLHPLRGLYDHYNPHLKELVTDYENINNIYYALNQEDTKPEELFRLIESLKTDESIPKEFFSFPSSFIKKIIHFLDKKGFESIKSFSAISKTVANRQDYFLPNINVKVIYPPSKLESFKDKSSEYFFTASRLDKPKRIDMIINAYKNAKTDIPLKIAGIGGEYEYLKSLISEDDKIELLGYVSDDELLKHYSKSYCVIFIPFEEDYGFITIEAMKCSKPIITSNDSGGVLEFVQDNETGLISLPNIESLSQKISYISINPKHAKDMGNNAKKRVENINWKEGVKKLFELPLNLTVVTTYPIYPPQGGGQNRVFYLYKSLAEYYNITIISLVHSSFQQSKKEIAPNLFEIQVPKSLEHEEREKQMNKEAGLAVTDIAVIDIFELSPEYIKQFKEAAIKSSFVLTTSPYTYPMIKKYSNRPIIYESQNVEYILKKQMLKDSFFNNELLKKVYDTEKECIKKSLLTTVCSIDDQFSFNELYNINIKTPLIPNGVDLGSVKYYGKKRKQFKKEILGYKDRKTAIFIGSEHKPNIDAVEEIIKIAKMKDCMLFIIVGGVHIAFKSRKLPNNILFKGFVDNDEKDRLLSISDVALNPMLSGSGSNLKMLDYIASGIPVISTKIGARGLNLPTGTIIIADTQKFIDYLDNISFYINIRKARSFVNNNYEWKVISKKLKHTLEKYNDH